MDELAPGEIGLEHEQGEHAPDRSHASRYAPGSVPPLERQQGTQADDHQGQVGTGGEHEPHRDREADPLAPLTPQVGVEQRRNGQSLGVELGQVEVVQAGLESVGDRNGDRRLDAELELSAHDPPQRHHAEGEGRSLESQQQGGRRDYPGELRQRRHDDRELALEQTPAGDRDHRLATLAQQPHSLEPSRKRSAQLERAVPGQSQGAEQQEQYEGDPPRDRPVGPAPLELGLPPQVPVLERPAEIRLEAGGVGELSGHGILSSRWGPLLRTLLTSVDTP